MNKQFGVTKKSKKFTKVTCNLLKIPNNMIISEVVTRNSNIENTQNKLSQTEVFKQRYGNIYDVNVDVPNSSYSKAIKWSPQLSTIHEYNNENKTTINPNYSFINTDENYLSDFSPEVSETNNESFNDSYELNEFLLPAENLNLSEPFHLNNSNHSLSNESLNWDFMNNWDSFSLNSNSSNSFNDSFNSLFNIDKPAKESKWTQFCQNEDLNPTNISNKTFEEMFTENVSNIFTSKIIESTPFNF